MEKVKFFSVIEKLKKQDPFLALSIESSIEGLSEGLCRELSEDEKMIAYTMFVSGGLYEKFIQLESTLALNKACLN